MAKKPPLSLHQDEPSDTTDAESEAQVDITSVESTAEDLTLDASEDAIDESLPLSEDNTLLQEPPKAFQPTIELPTPHHWRLVKAAIDDRVKSLKAIGKKVGDEGYIREARVMEQDALALSEDVSPQLEVQAEIPLATADEVQSGVANELRGVVRRHVRRDQQDVDHEAQMLKELSERVERFACEVANRAYAAGLSAREATAEVFALKSLNALRR